jgi:flagellar hook-basal body complex protein FliE
MVLNVANVTSAYKKTGGIIDDADNSAATPAAAGGDSFGNMVQNFLGDAVTSLHEGETKAAASMTPGGKSDLATVVTAMDNAELTLTEITAIRDKVITAYQTITSSAI